MTHEDEELKISPETLGQEDPEGIDPFAFDPETDPETEPPETDDRSWGDKIGPKKLSHRHETLCYMAAAGLSNKHIAVDLGLTESRVSVLLSNTLVSVRIKQIQKSCYGDNIERRLKKAVPVAMQYIEETLTDDRVKPETKSQNARWVIEKVTGKPAQKVDVEGNYVLEILNKLDGMAEVGPSAARGPSERPQEVLEIEARPADPITDWITANIEQETNYGREKEAERLLQKRGLETPEGDRGDSEDNL